MNIITRDSNGYPMITLGNYEVKISYEGRFFVTYNSSLIKICRYSFLRNAPTVNSTKYGGHDATLLIYFIFWIARAEDRTRGCLTAARRATCGLRRHPRAGYVATLNTL